MKKSLFCVVLACILAFAGCLLFAPVRAQAEGLTLSASEAVLAQGKSVTLKVTGTPEGISAKKVTWSSSDPAVATVKGGAVKGVAPGSCDIVCRSAEDESLQAVCHITVRKMIQSIQVKEKKMTVAPGASARAEVAVKPADATLQQFRWSSSDPSVCAVDADGNLSGVGYGNCEITCEAADGSGKSASFSVHVPMFAGEGKTVQVTDPEGLLVPLPLNASALGDLAYSVSGSDCFLCSVDAEGLHIHPFAAGTASVTLSNKKDKDDRAVYTAEVQESAVFVPSDEKGKEVRIILVPQQSQAAMGEAITVSYAILGLGDQTVKLRWGLYDNIGEVPADFHRAYSGEETLKQRSGTWTLDPRGYSNPYSRFSCYIQVQGDRGVIAREHCSVEITGGMALSVLSEAYTAQRGIPFRILFHCSGGKAPYKLKIEVRRKGGEKKKSETISVTTDGLGEVTLTPGTESEISLLIKGSDAKKGKINWRHFISIPVGDDAPVLLDVSHPFERTAEGYVLRFAQGSPGRDMAFTFRGATVYETVEKLKAREDGSFLIPIPEGSMGMFPYQLSGTVVSHFGTLSLEALPLAGQ